MADTAPPESLAAGLLAGQRRALAKSITLVESSLPRHREQAQALLAALLPHTGGATRIGISGVPGVGKSSFIEALGMDLMGRGHRVAVLAIDPSSELTGGAILGDKTRMETLARQEAAFIRPSPARGTLGGVAAQTREALLLCEAAGYDIVIVETVGVGQSETLAAGMTDVFVVLQLPNAGDELQAIKKGILELADLVVYNKADLDPRAAQLACGQMRSALGMLRQRSAHWAVPVLACSALRRQGLELVWQTICEHGERMRAAGEFSARRRRQALDWTWSLIEAGLRQRFDAAPAVQAALAATLEQVGAGSLAPAAAASRLLDRWSGAAPE